MGQYAVKLADKGRDFYIHWSEVVDAPVFVAVSLEDYRAYFRTRFGTDAEESWEIGGDWERLERAGVSTAHYRSAAEAVASNRAGADEEQLTVEGIRRRYLRGRTASETC